MMNNLSLKSLFLLILMFLVVGCTSAEPPSTTVDEPEEVEVVKTATELVEPTDIPPTDTPPPTEPAVSTPEPTDEPAPPASTDEPEATVEQASGLSITFSEADATEMMYVMAEGPRTKAMELFPLVRTAGDEQFIPVLIEIFRFGQLGIVRWGLNEEVLFALESLSGENFGYDWDAWVRWYGATDIEPPEGFGEWKGRLLAEIDGRFAEFFTNTEDATIRVEEIQWGGVVLDGIPALDNPTMIAPEEATYLDPTAPVFGLSFNGDSRAYPMQIMDWHEMANDVVGGVPVSIAYCTLCGAAIAYDGRASDGETYTFGSSGFLYRSNKLMYDRNTRTIWNQFSGLPVMGELVGADVSLPILPIVLTTWAEWQEQHPDTVVVSEETGHRRDYSLGAAYGSYFSSPDTMFPVWQQDDALELKDQVYVLTIDDMKKGYPIEILSDNVVTNDVLAETAVVLVSTRGIIDVTRDGSKNTGANRIEGLGDDEAYYTAGSEVRAYETAGLAFSPTDDADTIMDADGNLWTVTEAALISADGEELPRLGGHLAFWFGLHAFFPDAELYANE